MSTAKRSKRRQLEAKSASPLPASKRLKTTKSSHVPAAQSGLGFLVDEDVRQGKKLEARLTNGVPGTKNTRLDESRAVIAPDHGDDHRQAGGSQEVAIDISSAEESSSEEEDDDVNGQEAHSQHGGAVANGGQQLLLNGHAGMDHGAESEEDAVAGAEDVEMAENEQEDEEEAEEPSFGDMLKARHPEPIDVQAAFPNPMADRQALIPASGGQVLAAPSGTSLGTVLTQALKTNDKYLLESCFNTTDLPSIRSTIQRLQSQHVATLLKRLAERIHKRPGRTGNLMVWVQWSLVAHGGYLATQPDLVKQLKSLSQVVRERAYGLQPLLHLKGKLDMLSAQLELRKNMQSASRAANAEDDDNEEGVVYVEGQDDDWSDSEDGADEEMADNSRMLEPPPKAKKAHGAIPLVNGTVSDNDSESDEDMPNGVAHEAAEDSSDAEEDEPGMFDIEAEVTDDDEDDEEEDSDEEADSNVEDESEVDLSDNESDASGVKAPKPTTLNRKR